MLRRNICVQWPVSRWKRWQKKLAAITDWTAENVHQAIQSTADELEVGMGKVGMPLRVAVTGAGQSPGLDVTVCAIGQQRSIARIRQALAFIATREAQG